MGWTSNIRQWNELSVCTFMGGAVGLWHPVEDKPFLNKGAASPLQGFPSGSVVRSTPANAGDTRGAGSIPGLGGFPWRRKCQPTPVFLPGKFHGQRNLVGYSPWGHKESDIMEWLSTQACKKRSGRNLKYLNLVLGGRRKTKFPLKMGTTNRFLFWFVV